MTDTFSTPPLLQPAGQVTLRTRKAQFGDGYVQDVQDGINSKVSTWPLSWMGPAAAMKTITDFFDSHIAVSFFWTPPGGVEGLYKVRSYTETPQGNGVTLVAATFEENFQP